MDDLKKLNILSIQRGIRKYNKKKKLLEGLKKMRNIINNKKIRV